VEAQEWQWGIGSAIAPQSEDGEVVGPIRFSRLVQRVKGECAGVADSGGCCAKHERPRGEEKLTEGVRSPYITTQWVHG